MTATLKYRILGFLSEDTSLFHSISDISKRLGVAYSHAHMFVNKLVEEDVIRIQKIGNVSVCRLQLSFPLTLSYLSIVESRRTAEWMKKNPQSAKLFDKIESVKDNVHCVLLKNSRVIIVVPERLEGADFSMFRNRVVVNQRKLVKNKKMYGGSVILHGAEKYWSLMNS
ncbi:hypothetical protein ACFL3V_04020 [Nanoarchaeota archaeon]